MDQSTWQPVMLFSEVNRAHRSAVQLLLSRNGLGDLGAPVVLMVLNRREQEGLRTVQKDLAAEMHVSPPTIAISLKALERNGYIERSPNPADARSNEISLTARGKQAAEDCLRIFSGANEEMLRDFTPEEITVFSGLLTRMLDNLNRYAQTISVQKKESQT